MLEFQVIEVSFCSTDIEEGSDYINSYLTNR
jgi:hypothetical protein